LHQIFFDSIRRQRSVCGRPEPITDAARGIRRNWSEFTADRPRLYQLARGRPSSGSGAQPQRARDGSRSLRLQDSSALVPNLMGLLHLCGRTHRTRYRPPSTVRPHCDITTTNYKPRSALGPLSWIARTRAGGDGRTATPFGAECPRGKDESPRIRGAGTRSTGGCNSGPRGSSACQ
jgi:hypothetical protein